MKFDVHFDRIDIHHHEADPATTKAVLEVKDVLTEILTVLKKVKEKIDPDIVGIVAKPQTPTPRPPQKEGI